jgi:hypothetical protein
VFYYNLFFRIKKEKSVLGRRERAKESEYYSFSPSARLPQSHKAFQPTPRLRQTCLRKDRKRKTKAPLILAPSPLG